MKKVLGRLLSVQEVRELCQGDNVLEKLLEKFTFLCISEISNTDEFLRSPEENTLWGAAYNFHVVVFETRNPDDTFSFERYLQVLKRHPFPSQAEEFYERTVSER